MKKQALWAILSITVLGISACIPTNEPSNIKVEPIVIVGESQTDSPENNPIVENTDIPEPDTNPTDDEKNNENKGKWVMTKSTSYSDDEISAIYEYYEDGNVSKWSYYEDGELESYYEYEYNDKGIQTIATGYNADGTEISYDESVYNDFGNLMYSNYVYRDMEGTLYSWNEISYDQDKGKCFEDVYTNGELVTKVENDYDKNGNLIKCVQTNPVGDLISTQVNEYYSDGTLKKVSIIGYFEMVTEYDKEGYATLIEKRELDGSLIEKIVTENEYSEDGMTSKTTYYDADENVTSFSENEFDKEGRATVIFNCDGDGNVIYHDETDYDEDGNILTWRTYDSDGNTVSWMESSEAPEYGATFKTYYNADGSITQYISYALENGEYLMENYADNVLQYYNETEYDENGNKIKWTHYNGDDEVLYWDEYEYSLVE